jgi:hypothetical protein
MRCGTREPDGGRTSTRDAYKGILIHLCASSMLVRVPHPAHAPGGKALPRRARLHTLHSYTPEANPAMPARSAKCPSLACGIPCAPGG